MLVFWEQKLAILATPKTGSTAIEAALDSLASISIQRPPVLKHTNVQRYHRFLGPYFEAASGDRFTVVALMREPRDWLGSWYRYRQREDVPDQKKNTRDVSFDTFVRGWCSDPQPDYAAVGSQARFLAPQNGKRPDRIFRYEKIEDFLNFLEERLDFEIQLPRLNVSPAANLTLSAETESLLKTAAAADFELYNSLP